MIEPLTFEVPLNVASRVLIAEMASVQRYALVIGIGTFLGGVLLLLHHKRQLDEVLASDAADRITPYESRKYRRRALVSTLIASLGTMLASLFWVDDQRVFATIILIILALLVGIAGLALLDLFSVGLHQLSTPDEATQKAMIEAFLRDREKAKQEERDPLSTPDDGAKPE